jgi:hypothetical protein
MGSLATALSVWLCPLGSIVSNATGDTTNYFSDYDYYGKVDSFTGEPVQITEGDSTLLTDSSRIYIAGEEYYDYTQHAYVFPVENGLQEVSSSVADGMIVSEPVIINFPEGLLYTVYLNGQPFQPEGESFRDIGEYTVSISDAGKESKLFSFTIVGKKTGLISGYTMPTGFRIIEAYLNGQDTDYSKTYISLEAEGKYEIRYHCVNTGIEYTLSVETDHTPPAVTFEKLDDRMRSFGPVTVVGLEPTDSVVIIKDDREVALNADNRLTQSGHYQVWVTDDAMNRVITNFTIMIYLDSNGILFVLVILAVIGGFVAYLIWQRKHLRVR